MRLQPNPVHRIKKSFQRIGAGSCGSQIVEFALSVPLLVLFVVGIFDFSGALVLKHRLTNAAREAARVAAADPATDLAKFSTPVPVSVSDAAQVVDNYLVSEKINDCGLNSPTWSNTAGSLSWLAKGTGCASVSTTGLQVTINRGCISPQTMTLGTNSGTVYLVGTCVSIVYPYVWQFTSVAGLFSRFVGPSNITTSAAAFNEN
jgi:Flp pilus assembly protein TadG